MSATERLPLSRHRIADAALALIDAVGLEGLSMRKLGAELGVEAMSLYNHVANKADLLDAVVNTLYAEVLDAYGDPDGDWKTHARALSHAFTDVAASHPRAVSLLISPAHDVPAAVEFDRRVVEAASLITDDPRVGALAFSTLANWVIGTIVQEHGHRRHGDDASLDRVADDQVLAFRNAVDTITERERFDEGLEVVLAGLEARLLG